MGSEAGARVQLHSLTGVRAIAAVLVFWHHGAGLFDDVPTSGMVGVSLFYMLSGFVMAWTDRTGDTAGAFYRRRFARIYPAYAVAVLGALAVALITRDVAPSELVAFTLLQSWFPNETIYFAASAVFWSLSCEAFFYATFPLLRRFTRRFSDRGVWVLLGIAAVVSVGVGAVASGAAVTERLTWAVVVFPPVRLPEFVIGVCLGTLMARGWRPAVSVPLAWAVAAAAVAVALFVPYSLSRYAVTLIPFAVLIVALAMADLRGSRTIASVSVMVTLGKWSYCFYLVHLTTIMVVVSVGNRVGLSAAVELAVSLAVSVLAAWVLHTIVEVPAEKRLRPSGRGRVDAD